MDHLIRLIKNLVYSRLFDILYVFDSKIRIEPLCSLLIFYQLSYILSLTGNWNFCQNFTEETTHF